MLKPDADNSGTMFRIRLPVTLVRSKPQDELEEMLDEKIK